MTSAEQSSGDNRLAEVARVCFRLGCIAFGGPAAHIALLEREVVGKRQWLTREHFLDLMGATNLIPGPNSTEMVMHCGHARAGVPGLVIAGVCFILPAALITGLLAWLYGEYGALPAVAPYLAGIKPAMLAVIALAVYTLGKSAIKNTTLLVLGLLTLQAVLLGVNEITALLGAGAVGAVFVVLRDRQRGNGLHGVAPVILLQAAATPMVTIPAGSLFLVFLKIGAVLYGSGYVLFAYLDAELVAHGWLTRQQLLDAIAAGQFTPGPILSTATFVGYQLSGWTGAVMATAGIFLPSFLFVWLLNPLVPRLRRSAVMGHFLDAVNVAAVALMVAALFAMGMASVTDWRSLVIAVVSMAVTFGVKTWNPMWTVVGAAGLGALFHAA
jgi:chromate transporter